MAPAPVTESPSTEYPGPALAAGGPEADPDLVSGAIEVDYDESVVTLTLVGEHDLGTARYLEVTLDNYVKHDCGIVVSLAGATFLDSSTIRVLFASDRAMLAKGRRLVLHTTRAAAVDSVLDISGLREALICCESLEDARDFARQSSGLYAV